MKKQSKYRYAHTAVGASGLALIMGLVNVAVGATVTVNATAPVNAVDDLSVTATGATGTNAVSGQQFQFNSINAVVDGSTFEDIYSGNSVIDNANNTISANAAGNIKVLSTFNVLDSTLDFSVDHEQIATLDGASETIGAVITDPLIRVDLSAPLGSVTLSGNLANASVVANQNDTSLINTNLTGFSTALAGSAAASINVSSTAATANGVLANYQAARNAGAGSGSAATVDGASITVDASTLPAGSTIDLSGNQVAASYGANDASNQYAGSGTNFEGSLALTSLQDNVDSGTGTDPSAAILDSGVLITASTSIDGDVTVSDQAFNASSSGNAADNSLAIDVVTSINSTLGSPTLTVGTTNAEVSATDGTLVVANVQRNSGARLSSSIDTTGTQINGLDTGGTGVITLSDNTSLASASGNDAANSVSANAGSIDGASLLVGNAQRNEDTDILATNTGNMVVTGGGIYPFGFLPISQTGEVTLSGNSIGSSAEGNRASNASTGTAVTSINSADGVAFQTISRQVASGGEVSAGSVGIIGGYLTDDSGAVTGTVTGNSITSSARTNIADNRTTIAAGSGSSSALTTNTQLLLNDAKAEANTDGDILAAVINGSATDGSANALTVSGNTLSAAASGNESVNDLNTTVTTAFGEAGADQTATVTNYQWAGSAVDITSRTTSTVGIGALSVTPSPATAANSSPTLVVTGNTARADTTGSHAENSVSLTVGSVAGDHRSTVNSTQEDDDVLGTRIASVSLDIGIMADNDVTDASLSTIGNQILANSRNNLVSNAVDIQSQSSLASATSVLSNTQISGSLIEATAAGNFGIQGDDSIAGAADVMGNALKASASANSASNSIELVASTSVDTSGARLESSQTSQSDVSSAASGLAVIEVRDSVVDTDALDGTANVLNNTLQAVSAQNEASNLLAVTAGSAIGGSASGASTGSAIPDATGDYVLLNIQDAALGTTTATLNAGAGVTTSAGDIVGTSIVTGNILQAQAGANFADNMLAINSGTNAAPSAALSNVQSASGAVTATTTLDGGIGVTTDGSITGESTVSGNAAKAQAFGNNAINTLAANAGAGAYAGTTSTSVALNAGAITSQADLINSNYQTNNGAISASVTGDGLSVGLATLQPSVAGYNSNVLNNSVSAVAFGSSAVNALNVSSLSGASTASSVLASTQLNTGAISATVSNAGMGVSGVIGGTDSGRSVVSGNTISATAVGNSSVSQVVIGR